MAKKVINPEAALERRPNDLRMTDEQYQKISLFARLKPPISLDKFPGTMVVRRYKKGEVICRQGEAGWTAFYILTTEDMQTLSLEQLKTATSVQERHELQSEVTMIGNRLSDLLRSKDVQQQRAAATVHLTIAGTPAGRRPGLFHRWLGGGRSRTAARQAPATIPIDAPTEVDYGTLTAVINEGELFGEMSCLYRSPRSATIVAARDLYVLEMLRNILDQLQKNKTYKAEMDRKYKERVLSLHLRKLSIFSDLTEEQYQAIRDSLDLVSFEPGQIVFDEHERADSMYIVRSGLVKILKKASPLLHRDNVRDWKGLCARLLEGAANPATPLGRVWAALPEPSRAVLTGLSDLARLSDSQAQEILHGLNELVKSRTFPETKELQPFLAGPAFEEKFGDLPASRKQWTDQALRRVNRWLLEAVLGHPLRVYRPRVGPERVLSYCAKGDLVGEVGVMERTPHDCTCLAYGHPVDGSSKESGTVELVRIPAEVFSKMLDASPAMRRKVEALIGEHRKKLETQPRNVAEMDGDVQFSERFQSLGLIQGQRLMLIDLERCTRCDECVRACVNTHDDGRSRLFLDGPRFDKYLVPVTCRSCLDPVCMIGCPVGSIHRGDNGQIVIENWCIGCGLCAGNCPYGSIHMHDIGLVPEKARGWRFSSSAVVAGDSWCQPRFNDSAWAVGEAPFYFDREFQSQLAQALVRAGNKSPVALDQPAYFRYESSLSSELLRRNMLFKLEVTSVDEAATVWVNGQQLQTDEKPKRGKREFALASAAAAGLLNPLRSGRNVIAVRAKPNRDIVDVPILQVRLDAVPRLGTSPDLADEITQKVVTEQAVVCDLCSDSFGQVPACVNACPHDAAMRVDARLEFPSR